GDHGEDRKDGGAAREDGRRHVQAGRGPLRGAAGAQRSLRAGGSRRHGARGPAPGREQPVADAGARGAGRAAAWRIPDAGGAVSGRVHGSPVRPPLLLQAGPEGRRGRAWARDVPHSQLRRAERRRDLQAHRRLHGRPDPRGPRVREAQQEPRDPDRAVRPQAEGRLRV
ncbi:MAG: hypothetical protein AVDCRST_MAG05-4678, partial [uncultured Rubrobacteraceae bacterium]